MKFKLQHKNGGEVSYRATDYFSFQQDLDAIPTQEICDYTFFIDGKLVSFDFAEKVAQDCVNAFIAKRNETKKQIRISVGATCLPNTYRTVWVKK